METIKTFIEGWLYSDLKKMGSALTSKSENKITKAGIQALYKLQKSLKKELLTVIIKTIESSPKNINFFAILLYEGLSLCNRYGKKSEFNRLLNILENLNLDKIQKEYRALLYLAKHLESKNNLDLTGSVKWLKKAEIAFPYGSKRWYMTKCNRLHNSIMYHVKEDIEKEITIMKKYPQYINSFISPDYMLTRYYEVTGNPKKALNILQTYMDNSNTDYSFKDLYRLQEPNLYWINGQTKEGDRSLDKYIKNNPTYINTHDYFIKLAERARILNEPDNIKKNVTKALHKNDLSLFSTQWTNYLLLCAELIQGQKDAARRILKTSDPDLKNKDLFPEWVRLFLLEGNYEKAAYYYHQLINKNKTRIYELSYAHEIRFQQIIKLQNIINFNDFSNIKKEIKEEQNHQSNSNQKLFKNFIGNNHNIVKIKTDIQMMASQKAPVLISGETGTGKEVAAKLLHHLSDRSKDPFIPVNCGGISSTLIEAELFGYKKGAFTGAVKDHKGLFEEAGNGTIFLDEISAMPKSLQATLLRVLENMEVRPVGSTKFIPVKARVVAATNVNLEKLIEEKKFRLDLYFRLNRLQINLPSLNDRKEDIPLIIQYFLNQYAGDSQLSVDDNLMNLLSNHDWPGNIRELKNEIERMVIFAGNNKILSNEVVQFKKDKNKTEITPAKPSNEIPSISEHIHDAQPTKRNYHPSDNMEPNNYKNIRKQRLLALFQENKILTRAMVIRFLGCAANTAANDLKSLEADGYIEKVIPTASKRSSYYQFIPD